MCELPGLFGHSVLTNWCIWIGHPFGLVVWEFYVGSGFLLCLTLVAGEEKFLIRWTDGAVVTQEVFWAQYIFEVLVGFENESVFVNGVV